MPETAIKFGTYEAAKRALANFEGHGDPKRINSYSKFTAGGVAGMMAQYDPRPSLKDCLANSLREPLCTLLIH